MVELQPPITREQLEALVFLHGCYICKLAYSTEWHIRMKVRQSPYGSYSDIPVCCWDRDLGIDYWAREFPKAVRLVEQESFAGRADYSGVSTHRV